MKRLIVFRKAQKEKIVTLRCSESALESLLPLLEELQKMGRQGASRSIIIEDWDHGKFGFDGDGWDKISSIEVSGQLVKSEEAESARGDSEEDDEEDEDEDEREKEYEKEVAADEAKDRRVKKV